MFYDRCLSLLVVLSCIKFGNSPVINRNLQKNYPFIYWREMKELPLLINVPSRFLNRSKDCGRIPSEIRNSLNIPVSWCPSGTGLQLSGTLVFYDSRSGKVSFFHRVGNCSNDKSIIIEGNRISEVVCVIDMKIFPPNPKAPKNYTGIYFNLTHKCQIRTGFCEKEGHTPLYQPCPEAIPGLDVEQHCKTPLHPEDLLHLIKESLLRTFFHFPNNDTMNALEYMNMCKFGISSLEKEKCPELDQNNLEPKGANSVHSYVIILSVVAVIVLIFIIVVIYCKYGSEPFHSCVSFFRGN